MRLASWNLSSSVCHGWHHYMGQEIRKWQDAKHVDSKRKQETGEEKRLLYMQSEANDETLSFLLLFFSQFSRARAFLQGSSEHITAIDFFNTRRFQGRVIVMRFLFAN